MSTGTYLLGADFSIPLLNVQLLEKTCNCPLHNNELLQQIDAQLPNGKFVRVMLDSSGYYIAISKSEISNRPSKAVSKAEVIKRLQEAMR